MDRISQLPEPIIHRILNSFDTFLAPPVDLVRMSVLSKTWFDLTASFPILDFCEFNFRSPQSFFKYVEYTTSRFCHQNVTAQRLHLSATLQEPTEMGIVNKCLELVLKKGVKVLVVDITCYCLAKYHLPDILLSVSVLESLTIRACELPSSLMADAVKLKSLIRLKLEDVLIDDEGIKYLTSGCPLLQDLEIVCCYGFKSICVYGHQNLQHVSINYDTPVERIEFDAPNLFKLRVHDSGDGIRRAPQMNLASCKKLTRVTYHGHPLPNDFLSNFPFIENLSLVTENTCTNLKWSSHSLRTFVLESECALDEIELNTPNLVLFVYGSLCYTISNKCWPLLRDSTHLKACMQCYPYCTIDVLWFRKLRLFLDKKNGFKVLNLYIKAIYEEDNGELEGLDAIKLPPYELEHVELEIDTHEESSAHMAFVDVVLWCCRPQYLTLSSSFPLTDFEDVVKFTCKKLLEQEGQGHISIQIVSHHEGNSISFIKQSV